MRKEIICLLPNALSAMRFPLGGTFAFMLAIRFAGKTISPWSLLVCFAAIAMSDLLDGWIARNFSCQSNIGAALDVSSDSFYILLSLAVLNACHIVPIWFTATVVLKLADFILSSRIFSASKNGYFVFDPLGRLTAGGFYIVPILAGICPYAGVIGAVTLFLAFTAMCSSLLRWFSFVWHIHK